MKPIICDTNVFIKLFSGDTVVINELSKIGNDSVLMPSITAMELYVGMRNKGDLQQMSKNLKKFNIVHINQKASQKAIDLIQSYRLSHGLLLPDALIAAISISYDIELFTYNQKDFKFLPNIKLYPLP